MALSIEPPPGQNGEAWRELAAHQPYGTLLGHPQSAWREKTRRELGLATDRPIIATGHQTLLWHPGILAKYLIVDRIAQRHGFATANLIVDQHVGPYGQFDVPIRRADASLQVRMIDFVPDGTDPARREVPMGLQPAFAPADPPMHLPFALECVREGVQQISRSVWAHRDAPNAAIQMALALNDLMQRWVRIMPHVAASELGETSLARRMMEAMIDDPRTMAETYNAAVRAVPEAGIPPLLIHDLYVEVPLWRIRSDGRRMRAYDNDLEKVLETPSGSSSGPDTLLLPRALFMTALVRLGMCDLYVHGTGGAVYDRAMELWMRNWLDVHVAPIGVVTATLHLPLETGESVNVNDAMHVQRHTWHDPARDAGQESMSEIKRRCLDEINDLPRRSSERKAAFFRMHEQLEQLREAHRERVEQMHERSEAAQRRQADQRIAIRRDWPFPLYPTEAIDRLAQLVDDRLAAAAAVR